MHHVDLNKSEIFISDLTIAEWALFQACFSLRKICPLHFFLKPFSPLLLTIRLLFMNLAWYIITKLAHYWIVWAWLSPKWIYGNNIRSEPRKTEKFSTCQEGENTLLCLKENKEISRHSQPCPAPHDPVSRSEHWFVIFVAHNCQKRCGYFSLKSICLLNYFILLERSFKIFVFQSCL